MIQGSLFEQDFLVRTLGTLAQSPHVALTELVANAWDAGASYVAITMPDEYDQQMIVKDDGCGMTPEQFRCRWMTLGYDRVRHQGVSADFPAERADWKRRAFGRNGVGRHGLLCFGPEYQVESVRDGKGGRYLVRNTAGEDPFVLVSEEILEAEGHGTALSAKVTRNLPSPDSIREVPSARFLHDPRFTVLVNGQSVPLSEHSGLINRIMLRVMNDLEVEAFFIDSAKAARTTQHQGIAFWVGGRLVGVPSWILGTRAVIDGRTTIAKRHTVVIKAEGLFDEVLPDWSGFRESETVKKLHESVGPICRRDVQALVEGAHPGHDGNRT